MSPCARARTPDEKVAEKLLKSREVDIDRGIPITPKTNRVTLSALLDDVLTDYKVNGRRSLDTVTYYIDGHLRPYFGTRKAASITTADVRAYVAHRQEEKAANATINRELAALTRAYSLGIEAGTVTQRPAIKSLKENNTRKGFFEREQFEDVRKRSARPAEARGDVSLLTGWRVNSEVLAAAVAPGGFHALARCGSTRSTTKNDEARVFPFTAELRALLDAQRAHTDAVQREHGVIIPHVFHRRQGKPIKTFRRSWATACTRGRMSRPHPPRLPAHGRAQPGARRHPRARRDADDRPQDARRVRALQHRQRGRPRPTPPASSTPAGQSKSRAQFRAQSTAQSRAPVGRPQVVGFASGAEGS